MTTSQQVAERIYRQLMPQQAARAAMLSLGQWPRPTAIQQLSQCVSWPACGIASTAVPAIDLFRAAVRHVLALRLAADIVSD